MRVGRKFVVGNWKMNGTRANAAALVSTLASGVEGLEVDVAVCAPFTLLERVAELAKDSSLGVGAQDLSSHERGAYTGEVSAAMLREAGCRFVLVGHSERRCRHQERNDLVGAKARMAVAAGLTPIACVGETLAQREAAQTVPVVLEQLDAVVSALEAGRAGRFFVAYEPVWAIGTGRSATPAQAQAVHEAMRAHLQRVDKELAQRTRILYGGSVQPTTAGELFAQPDIDGALVGGASLVAADFLAIVHAGAATAARRPQ